MLPCHWHGLRTPHDVKLLMAITEENDETTTSDGPVSL
jgi:hypothetical protein